MILNPGKVLVIYNTSDASGNSQAVAEYYAAARGLGHVQGYALGLVGRIAYASMAGFRSGVLTDIQTYIDANGIEGIVLSINCPRDAFVQNGSTYNEVASLCKIIGNCWRVTATADTKPYVTLARSPWGATDVDGSNDGSSQKFMVIEAAASGTFDPNAAPSRRVYDWRLAQTGSTDTLPCGRLGYFTGSFNDDVTLAERCIDDALWFEQNGNLASEPMLFGLSSRGGNPALSGGYAPLTYGNVYGAYRLLHDQVGAVHTYEGNSAGSAGCKYEDDSWGFAKPPISITDQVAFLAGNGPVVDVWGWLGTGAENIGNVWTGSVVWRRGGWMFESTSTDVSKHALLNGACACVIPVTEPTTSGLPEITGMTRQLLRGFSLMEAEMCSLPTSFLGPYYSCYSEVWGDPLYSPLAKLGYGRSAQVAAGAI